MVMMHHLLLLSCFMTMCLICAGGSSVPHHRKVRQVRQSDVGTYSEEDMMKMTPEMRRYINVEYTKEFFKPLNSTSIVYLKYYLDKKSFLHESPLFETVLQDLKPHFEEVDFDQQVRQNKGMFLPLYLQELQQKSDDYLTVNLRKMLTSLNNVFSIPRNYRSSALRNAASDYITQKLGNLGLLLGVQYFYPTKFRNQFVGYDANAPEPASTLPMGGNVFGILPGTYRVINKSAFF